MTKSTVTITGVTIMNGVASPGDNAIGSGGGIRDQGPISLTLDNDIITNNTATADGGGVSMENTVDTPWTLTLNATTVSDNHAGDAGGGVETDGSGNVFINSGCVITGNTAVNQGGGVWLDAIGNDSANLSIQAAVVSDNAPSWWTAASATPATAALASPTAPLRTISPKATAAASAIRTTWVRSPS